jgi:hypothetical protein
MSGSELVKYEEIQSRIYTIRGVQVILDSDLAEFYGVEVKRLNEQVKRNVERFPESFSFQLTDSDLEILISQVVTSINGKNLKSQFATSSWGGRRTKPYVFTEPCRGDAQNNSPEFEGNKNKAELNRFILSVKQLEDEERLNTPRLEILER